MNTQVDYQSVRHNMVENQIRPNHVTDVAVIEAMGEIPRELFVPESSAGIAYVDDAANLGDGRFLMEPMLLARLLQEMNVSADDVVLDIGCGTGYSTAVLAKMAKAVVAVEKDEKLSEKASSLMVDLGIDNAVVIAGDLKDGYAKQAPYDGILFSGAVPQVPQEILEQLSDGGRLLAVIANGKSYGRPMGKVVLMKKIGDTTSKIEIFDAGSPILPGFEIEKVFEL